MMNIGSTSKSKNKQYILKNNLNLEGGQVKLYPD